MYENSNLFIIRSVLDCRARSKNTAKNKLIGCFFIGVNILLAAFAGFFLVSFVVQKNATQSTVMRVNNKSKYAHQMQCAQMRANAYPSTRFLTRVCAKMVRAFCVCVGRLSLTCTVYIFLKSCLCCCSLATLAAPQ